MAFSFVSSLSLLSSCFISLVRNNNSLETLEVDGAYIFFFANLSDAKWEKSQETK